MNVQLFTIERSGPGTLSTMARPRGGDWLNDEMANLQASGVTMLVSFLTPNELSLLALENEPTAAEAAGIKFLSFPINDLSTSNPETYRELLKTAQAELDKGGHVVGHCRIGIGRASMFAAAVLITEGVSVDEAWETVAEARGLAVPDTDAQRAWVGNFLR